MERILSRTLRPDVLANIDLGEDQLIGSPINLGASNSTLKRKKKKIFKPTIHNEANTGKGFATFDSCLRAGFVSKDKYGCSNSNHFPHSFQASRQHLISCVHTDSLKPLASKSTCSVITVRTCLAVQYRFSRFFVICHVRTIWTFLTAVCNITKSVGVKTT